MDGAKKVLLIDDEVDFTELLAANLEEAGGYLVMQVNDPTTAVEVASSFRPDICIIDLVMPQMDGGDVVSALRANPNLTEVPVLMLTALVEESPYAPDKPQMKGGLPFVSKTSDLSVILKAIEERV
ncbi:MAG: response regulator [Verrucomicrobiaceae bacterium]